MSDPYKSFSATPTTFGRRGAVIVPSDSSDLSEVAKCVEVTDAGGGALRVLPAGNDDGDWIDYVGVPVGFSPKFQVRRVGEATNCTVASVLG